MATSYQRKPDAKDPRSLLDAIKQSPDKRIDPRLREAQEKLGKDGKDGKDSAEKAEVAQDVAAQLQASLGNAALQGLLKQGTETGTQTGESTTQEQQEQQEEEQQEEDKETEAGDIEHVLPSFTNGAGAPGGSPFSVGRFFGGDDDAEGDIGPRGQPRWRPMPGLPDPDEDNPLEGDDAGESAEPEPVDFEEADTVLGSAPWEPGLLARGLRHPHRATVLNFSAERLVFLNRLDTAYGRARAMLRFLATHAEGQDSRLIATATALAPSAEGAGFSGATAHALALCELVLRAMPEPEAWVPILEALLDGRTRSAVEEAAAELAPEGRLTAPELLRQVAGELPEGLEPELVEECHPAAWEALSRLTNLQPLPALDIWRPAPKSEEEGDEYAGINALLDEILGIEPTTGGITEEDLQALYDALNALLGALGLAQAEVACAGLAALPWSDPQIILGVTDLFDALVKKVARRLVRVGREIEALVGSHDTDQVTALSAEAVAVRGSAELVRKAAIASFGILLFDRVPEPTFLPDAWEEAGFHLKKNQTQAARACLDRALEQAEGDDDASGRLQILLGGMLLERGFAGAAEAHLSWGSVLLWDHSPHAGAAAALLELAIELDRGDFTAAYDTSQRLDVLGRQLNCPYVVAAAAIGAATARKDRWVLEEPGAWIRGQQSGAALNLLKARWAELAGSVETAPEFDPPPEFPLEVG